MVNLRFTKLLGTAGAALAAAAVLASAAWAATPAPGYAQFAGCPSPAENAASTACFRTVINGGYFQMGNKNVPITNPITLSGGIDPVTGVVSASPSGGMTPTKQKVPGGVVGLTGLTWLLELLGSNALTLYAVTELAGVPNIKPGFGEVRLPIKVHLINSVLGNNCYVGSAANPMNLNLTTRTTSPPPPNVPITGKEPTFSFTESPEIFHFEDGAFVDNSFAAPGASGCVLTLFGFIPVSINGLVNEQSGLPAPAGTNATEQKFDQEIANQANVYP
jgi:hypothetical protein